MSRGVPFTAPSATSLIKEEVQVRRLACVEEGELFTS
jgi:hypothetical protein